MYDWIIDVLYPFAILQIILCVPTILLSFVGREAFLSSFWFMMALGANVIAETDITGFRFIDFLIGASFQTWVWSYVTDGKPIGGYNRYW